MQSAKFESILPKAGVALLLLSFAVACGDSDDDTVGSGGSGGSAGTNLPGVITAGTFYQVEGAVFFDVHDPERTIVVELEHEHYQRLVLEVEDPEAVVARIRAAVVALRT